MYKVSKRKILSTAFATILEHIHKNLSLFVCFPKKPETFISEQNNKNPFAFTH